uniref:L-Fucosyltransferase n=1 Tax=Timema bartmani TaxID=61472 RepID=A0A7R9HVF1_9NEOP|nr:unnamed protein product [Timema bartmani]
MAPWSNALLLTGKSRQYTVLIESIVPLIRELKKEFKYKRKHLNVAQTLFVGVHVRRGDYIGYLRSGGVTTTADTSYYRHAMAWMLRKLSSESASSRNIAFILASDDEVWCKKKLIPEIKKDIRLLGNQTKLGGSSVFYLGVKTTPVVDLVMLSSCNHSIISYGTYGIWSALMANGWTVVYDMAARNKPKAVKKMNAPMEFSKHLHKPTVLQKDLKALAIESGTFGSVVRNCYP